MHVTRESRNTPLEKIMKQLPRLTTSEEKGEVLEAVFRLITSSEDRRGLLELLGGKLRFEWTDSPTNKDGSDVRIFNGGRTSIYAKQVSTKDGEIEIWWYVGRGPGVMVLPVVMDGNEPKIVLFEQIRPQYEVGGIVIGGLTKEIPAGILDSKRSLIETAEKEVLEEIGYSSRKLIPIGNWAMAPAYTPEYQVVYVALVEPSNKHENPDGDIKYILEDTVKAYTFPEANRLVTGGEVSDIRTVAAIEYAVANKKEIMKALLRQ